MMQNFKFQKTVNNTKVRQSVVNNIIESATCHKNEQPAISAYLVIVIPLNIERRKKKYKYEAIYL